ncbi:reverse transcriptase domain-containing protein, partial [Tanacetum coccineum]
AETQTTVLGFSGEIVKPLGKIKLDVCFGGVGRFRRAMMRFTIISAPSPYNIILGRSALKQLRAIPSTIHGMMKFPTRWGIATVLSQAPTILECRREEKKQAREKKKDPVEEMEPMESPSQTKLVLVNPAYPEQLVKIGKNLSPGVPKRIIKHSLNVSPADKPIAQKRRIFSEEKKQVITREVSEWLNAGIVRRVKYPTWISNPVLVQKPDGSWRMCIDFKNLNSSCPKDYYPLPEIDSKIEAVMGYPLKCFLDAYKGYHQVQMSEEDEEKTAFYTDQGTFCYKKMSFGLKNAGATYQRLVDEAFDKQIGRNLEVYVDDMVIKSKAEKDMLADIAETFDNLRRINMKLNPKKCSFGVEEGKFLGYMVTSEGIRANPAKTRDIAEMKSPRTWGEMQSLAGKLAALNRFLARSAEKSLPFFETLKNITKENKEDYRWTEEAEKAFQELKKTILNLPTLTTPIPEENLYIYLAASDKAVSAKKLRSVGKIGIGTQKCIKKVEKIFRSPPDYGHHGPADQADSGKSGNVGPPGTICVGSDTLAPIETTYTKEDKKDRQEEWTLFTDGASSSKGSGAGLVLISPTKTEYTYALRLTFDSTNNQAEYEALLAGMRIAKKMGVQALSVKVDSKLVASQINGDYVACKENMIRYLTTAKEYIKCFKSFRIKNIPRNQNQKADVLSKLASEEGENWMSPFIRCLEEGIWPEDEREARSLRMKINQYVMEEGILFKMSYLMTMLRCVGPLQANYVIREIHMGACSMHMKPRSVVAQAIRQGYYWPTMHRDAREEIRKCDSCQIHAPVPKMPLGLHSELGTVTPEKTHDINHGTLAILPMGDGCTRTTTRSARESKINTAVAHPQANGLVERANRSLMEGIKTRLGRERKGWVDELPNVLWAHRTSLKTSNGETPYSLTFGSEAVIPAEVGMPTYRTMMIKDGKDNEEEIRLNLDLLTERKEAAAIREARYKMKVEQYYNKRVRPMAFKVGEYVYRRNEASRVEDLGKLGPKWEGPYLVIEAYGNGSYKLQTMKGREVPRTWHAINLRRCYL